MRAVQGSCTTTQMSRGISVPIVEAYNSKLRQEWCPEPAQLGTGGNEVTMQVKHRFPNHAALCNWPEIGEAIEQMLRRALVVTKMPVESSGVPICAIRRFMITDMMASKPLVTQGSGVRLHIFVPDSRQDMRTTLAIEESLD
jgi:hypothetical protein